MTVVTWIMKKSRLSTLIDAAGGVTVGKALEAAEQNTQALRDQALAEVDSILGDLETLAAGRVMTPDDQTRAYALSSSLLDVAGPFGLEDMCKGAYSLCELVDRQRRAGRCDLAPVQVHVSALRLLRQLSAPAESRRQVLEGLEVLLAHSQRARV